MDWLTQAVLATLVITGSVVPAVMPESVPAAPTGAAVPEEPPAYPFPVKRERAIEPVVKAKSALLVDLPSGRELYSRNASARLPIASISKLMTAVLAVEHLSPKEAIVAPKLENNPEESLMGLQKGDRLRADDVLAGALIVSGNDAAETLADAVSGSEEAFVELMNQRARQFGMNDTHFDNSSGFAKGENLSSAHDLVILSRVAMGSPRIRGAVRQSERTVKALNARKPTPEEPDPKRTEFKLYSTDLLLGSYLPIAGLKTGTSDAAGPSLVTVLDDGKRRLLAVVLNSPDRFQENKSMLDWALRSYEW